ncbi:MAG: hypothetical protein ABJB66_04595 [Gemmatimonadaceae bacterium]
MSTSTPDPTNLALVRRLGKVYFFRLLTLGRAYALTGQTDKARANFSALWILHRVVSVRAAGGVGWIQSLW